MRSSKRVLIFGGPTGAGETTITKKLVEKFSNFRKLVTATSRPMRSGEQNKIDYYFFKKNEFEENIKNGNIVEHTCVKGRDAYYGSYKPDLDKKIQAGLNVIVNVDIVGAKFFKDKYNATTIFIMPRSLKDLRNRLIKRDPNITSEELEIRMKHAREEVEAEKDYYDYVVINEDGKLDKAVEKVVEILKKEKYELLSK